LDGPGKMGLGALRSPPINSKEFVNNRSLSFHNFIFTKLNLPEMCLVTWTTK
jgi:hypothetical protein